MALELETFSFLLGGLLVAGGVAVPVALFLGRVRLLGGRSPETGDRSHSSLL
jgi:hypothetical protein